MALIRYTVCIILCSVNLSNAQHIYLESGIGLGSVIKHSEVLKYDLDGLSKSFYVNGSIESKNLFNWAQYYGNPELQFEFQYMDYNSPVLGYSIGFYPSILFPIINRERFKLYFQLGSGLSYHSKIYDRTQNPLNNSVSSRFNNLTKIAFQPNFILKNKHQISLNVGLIHNSNGASKTPNRGINSISYNLLYKIPVLKLEGRMLDTLPKPNKFQVELACITTTRQGVTPNGPDLYFYEFSSSLKFPTSKVNYIGLGYSLALSEEDVDFIASQEFYLNRDEARRKAFRNSIFIEDELLMGSFGLNFITGFYIGTKYRPRLVYHKLNFKYYLFNRKKISPFLAIEIKSHLFTAEYIALKYGIRFSD